jgi:hypothetical protein
MECSEFIRQFEIQYPNVKWIDVQAKINGVIRQVFDVVTRFVMIIGFILFISTVIRHRMEWLQMNNRAQCTALI